MKNKKIFTGTKVPTYAHLIKTSFELGYGVLYPPISDPKLV